MSGNDEILDKIRAMAARENAPTSGSDYYRDVRDSQALIAQLGG